MKISVLSLWVAVVVLAGCVVWQQRQLARCRAQLEQLRAPTIASQAAASPKATIGSAAMSKLHCSTFAVTHDPENTNFYCIMGQAENISGKQIYRAELIFAISRDGYESRMVYAVTENLADGEWWKYKTAYIGNIRQPPPDVKLKNVQVFE